MAGRLFQVLQDRAMQLNLPSRSPGSPHLLTAERIGADTPRARGGQGQREHTTGKTTLLRPMIVCTRRSRPQSVLVGFNTPEINICICHLASFSLIFIRLG